MPANQSQILRMPYIQPGQAQKHVTHNEALKLLDVLVQLVVTSRNAATPPSDPPDGRRHIVPDGATGAWAGQAGNIAVYQNDTWIFIEPLAGWIAYVKDEQAHVFYEFHAGTWMLNGQTPSFQNLDMVGINTTADATNRLSAASDATLLSHDGDDHRLKVNKAASGDTASLLFQSGFSGRAEMGTTGSDDFSLRVSPDGSSWTTGLSVDAGTGIATAPEGLVVDGTLTGSAIVGTVAQSGGQPTGTIIERGSNANGHYTRWADGTQICWRNDLQISGTSSALIDTLWTLPAAFVAVQGVHFSLPYYSSHWSDASRRHNVSALVASAGSGTQARVGYYPITTPETVTIDNCSATAIGRWY